MPRLLCIALLVCGCVQAHESTLPHVLRAQAAPLAAPASLGPVAPVRLELRIAGETNAAPVAGLVRITSLATGRRVDLPAHLRRPMGWFSLPAGATIDLPVGVVRLEACRGLDTEIATLTTDIRLPDPTGAPPLLALTLRRFYDTAAHGLIAANTHLHLRLNSAAAMGGAALRDRAEAEAYLTAIGQSDALDLVYISHLVRASEDRGYVSNDFTPADLRRLSTPRLRFVNGEEHRHEGGRSTRRGGPDELRYGHVLFLDLVRLIEPVSYGAIFTGQIPNGDAVPMRRGIRQALAQEGTVIWCHGRQGTEDIPNWVDGLLHAQNIFDGGSDGSFEQVYYTYLNAGFRVPFSTGTDWGCYDFSRVYVAHLAEPTSHAFLEKLAAGRSFITNGPLLRFVVAGKHSGDTLELSAPGRVDVFAQAHGRDDFGRLEVVFNGAVVASAPSNVVGGHFVMELITTIEVREPGWLALRVVPDRPYSDRAQFTGGGANLFGKPLFAHTSPIYVTIGGRAVRQPAAVRTLIADTEAAIREIEAKGAFATDAERDTLLNIYRTAITSLRARL